jgi:hypothetical protein
VAELVIRLKEVLFNDELFKSTLNTFVVYLKRKKHSSIKYVY